MKVLLCSDSATLAVSLLASQLSDHEIITCPSDTIIKYLDSVDVVIPWMANIDASIIASGHFGLVQEFGVGIETIDIEAATGAGVWVAHVPGRVSGNADSVAEHAIMLMLMLSRHITTTQQSSKSEDWSAKAGIALLGKTACIVGLGDIGTALAVRLKAFGMRLVAVRQHPERGALPETGIEKVYGSNNLSEALSIADYIILCAEYTKNTHHLINQNTLAAIKPGAFLINVARGGLVDTDALEAALENGDLAGAGLDFVDSPTDSLRQQNVIITPHIAAITDVSYDGIAAVVIDNIRRYARGEQPRYTINTPHKLRR
ncbi:MAG: hydroxyacid dehydrogenase [Moorea sp. SIO4A1]|uniref:NAD(P)-dependent oxidoreductase n=1 Tax=Moorena sp. SIO4A1 TaxID=2607835 RepID=UPI001450AAD3|nr:NAD(P)-dependent oxidoreductase [Moorena sp. SIO4A1]NEQ63545.1 hydroxyacid dehydrogenase [Moorena sp. SIO4A1]